MSSAAIDFTQPKSYRSRWQLAASTACPLSYDITSADDQVGGGITSATEIFSYLYALGFHWVLYQTDGATGDVRVWKTDGVTDTSYLLTTCTVGSMEDGKLVSDGTNVWAAVSVPRDVSNPYRIYYDDSCADFIFFGRLEHDAATWRVSQIEVFQGTGGAFSQIGTVEAKFNNRGGGVFGGDLNGMRGALEGCASDQEPGVAYFGWSEAGFTGSQLRTATATGGACGPGICDACCSNPVSGGGCNCKDNDDLRLDDACRNPGTAIDPSGTLPTFPGSTFPGPEGDEYPVYVGDWSWFGMRFVVAVCSDVAITDELEPIGYMKSVATINYGDVYYDDSQIFEPTALVFQTALQMMNDGPTQLAFTAWPVNTDHGANSLSPAVEVTVRDLTTMGVLDTLDAGTAVATAGHTIDHLAFGATQVSPLPISRESYTDPVDGNDVYYIASYWIQENAQRCQDVHRVQTSGGGFEPLDLDVTRVASIRGALAPGTISPELWNLWVWQTGITGSRYERHCPRGWIADNAGGGGADIPTVQEMQLLADVVGDEDAVFYGSNFEVRRTCICRLCAPCPGEPITTIVPESPFENGQTYTVADDPVNWTVLRCSNSITEIHFYVDGDTSFDCIATTPVGNTFYYCDTPPGAFDVAALGEGTFDLCWDAYDACGELIETNCATITVGPAPTPLVLEIDDEGHCQARYTHGSNQTDVLFQCEARFNSAELDDTWQSFTTDVFSLRSSTGSTSHIIDSVFGFWDGSDWRWTTLWSPGSYDVIAPDTWYTLKLEAVYNGSDWDEVFTIDGVVVDTFTNTGAADAFFKVLFLGDEFEDFPGGLIYVDDPLLKVAGVTVLSTDFDNGSIVPPFTSAGCTTLVPPP